MGMAVVQARDNHRRSSLQLEARGCQIDVGNGISSNDKPLTAIRIQLRPAENYAVC
jgi:hypothetical protein